MRRYEVKEGQKLITEYQVRIYAVKIHLIGSKKLTGGVILACPLDLSGNTDTRWTANTMFVTDTVASRFRGFRW